MLIDRTDDGSALPPRLRRDINLRTMAMLPRGSSGWHATLAEQFALLKADGDVAVQSWYTGHEMTYAGEFLPRIARLQPVFERVRFMHVRVGNVGSIQTALDDPGDYLQHVRTMWQRCFEGFLRGAVPGDCLSFNAELLPMRLGEPHLMYIHCAQPRLDLAGDALCGEPSDRYADASLLWRIANECFAAAQAAMDQPVGDHP